MVREPPLRLLALVAHPDDAEVHSGGLATIYRQLGHVVRFVSLTNGESGHHEQRAPALVDRRRLEAEESVRLIGAEAEVWDNRDGQLMPTLDVRWQVVREIRKFKPDLVLTHRPNDYHPDHRAVGHVVRDASYLVTVPALVSDVPALERDPVVMYMADRFTTPAPLRPDVVLDITAQVDTVVNMLACHASQFFEWLPYNKGILNDVPRGDAGRLRWLKTMFIQRLMPLADRYRDELIATYGRDRGGSIQCAEVYEASEYAAPLDAAARAHLFPFVPI